MEKKQTFVKVDQDAIDQGMTSPDIMQWIRDEVARTYGPHAIITNISNDFKMDEEDLKITVNLLVPTEEK